MSMEEKALEPMLKNRVDEGKATLSTSWKKASLPPLDKRALSAKRNHTTVVKKGKYFRVPVDSTSSSSFSKEESSDKNVNVKQSSGGSSDTSSDSSSSDSDEDTADSEEPAKESFLKKQKFKIINDQVSRNKGKIIKPASRQINPKPLSTLGKVEPRDQRLKKQVNIDYDSDDIVSSRVKEPLKLSVRDRLGKSTALHKTSSDALLLSRAEKFRTADVTNSVATKKRDASRVTDLKVSKSSSSEDDHDPLADIKVKTFEEIRLEKMRKMAARENMKKPTAQESKTGLRDCEEPDGQQSSQCLDEPRAEASIATCSLSVTDGNIGIHSEDPLFHPRKRLTFCDSDAGNSRIEDDSGCNEMPPTDRYLTYGSQQMSCQTGFPIQVAYTQGTSPSGSEGSHHSCRETVASQAESLKKKTPRLSSNEIPSQNSHLDYIEGVSIVRSGAEASPSGQPAQDSLSMDLSRYKQPLSHQMFVDANASSFVCYEDKISDIVKSVRTFSAKILTELQECESARQRENQFLRASLEKEKFKRKHREEHIQKQNTKIAYVIF